MCEPERLRPTGGALEAAASIKDDADLPKATAAINRLSGELASGEPKVRELAAAHLACRDFIS